MVMTAVLMVGIVLVIGLCVDVAHIFMVRSELQNAADAAALAAVRELDSTPGGITSAADRATSIVNKYGQNKTAAVVPRASVTFAAELGGPYLSEADARAAGTASTIRFVRVATQPVAVTVLFAVSALGSSYNQSGVAVAGMSIGLNTVCGIAPFAVAYDTMPANHTQVALHFTQGSGTSVTVNNGYYVILNTSIAGGGSKETKEAMAGSLDTCLGNTAALLFDTSNNNNQKNGPANVESGMNTRFDIYKKNDPILNATNYPPDTNVKTGITFSQYDTDVQAPTSPGVDNRRVLVVPIISPVVGGGTTAQLNPSHPYGVFFIKNSVDGTCKPSCPAGTSAPGDILAEYVNDPLAVGLGKYDPGGGLSTSLTLPVLYK